MLCSAFIICNWYVRYTIKTINKIHFIDFYVYLLRSITCFAHFVRSNDKVELIWPVLRVLSVTLQWASDAQVKYCWGYFTVVRYHLMLRNRPWRENYITAALQNLNANNLWVRIINVRWWSSIKICFHHKMHVKYNSGPYDPSQSLQCKMQTKIICEWG